MTKKNTFFLDPEMLLLVFLVNLVGVDTILTRSATQATKTAAIAVFSTYMAAVGINSLSDENARLISSTLKNGGTAMVDAGVEIVRSVSSSVVTISLKAAVASLSGLVSALSIAMRKSWEKLLDFFPTTIGWIIVTIMLYIILVCTYCIIKFTWNRFRVPNAINNTEGMREVSSWAMDEDHDGDESEEMSRNDILIFDEEKMVSRIKNQKKTSSSVNIVTRIVQSTTHAEGICAVVKDHSGNQFGIHLCKKKGGMCKKILKKIRRTGVRSRVRVDIHPGSRSGKKYRKFRDFL